MRRILANKWFIYIAGLAFFFSVFRYNGFYEDAGRYLLQVIHILHPDRFINDVPFMFGNQDEFTFFSPLMSLFFQKFGINHGGIIATLLMEFLWGIAAITFFFRSSKYFGFPIFSLPLFIICIITCTNKFYGSNACLPILEYILVARIYAEIFILFGLAFLWSNNKYISIIFFITAFLFHPLMGGWGIPLWLLYHFPKTRFPLSILAILLPLTGFLHINRFDFFPNDWFEGGLPFTPTGSDALVFTGLLVFWWYIWIFSKNKDISKFASVIFWIYLIGIFWQYIGIGMRHQLLVQVQPYRALWIGFIPMFPVAYYGLRGRLRRKSLLATWLIKKEKNIKISFIIGALFLIFIAILKNIIQLSLEQNIGNVNFAVSLLYLPDKLAIFRYLLLCFFTLICILQRKKWLALAFGFALFNSYLTLLPLLGIIFYLKPNLGKSMQKILIAFFTPFSIIEFLESLGNSPLLGSQLDSALLFIIVFVLSLWICLCPKKQHTFQTILPLTLFILTFAIYDVRHWDARGESTILDEKQMDYFLAKTIFPQIKDRGKILFVENKEASLQSRFKFLTGTYADETIDIGSIFFKGQYIESRKRKNALLLGDTIIGYWGNYSKRIAKIYQNPDTLLARVYYLCSVGEITHFATDYTSIPLPKQDSLFLDVKQKNMWLYKCTP